MGTEAMENAFVLENYLFAGVVGVASALVTTAFSAWLQGRRTNSERHREHFANALAAVTEYWEFPYAIRRRGRGNREAERLRLSSELRVVQQKLAFHQAWLRIESPRVAAMYDCLVTVTRRVAGQEMHQAWKKEPISADAEMNVPGLEMGDYEQSRSAYLDAVETHLSWRGKLHRRT